MAARRPPPEAKARARPRTARAAVLILFAVWLAFAFPLLTGMVRFPVQFDPAVAGSFPASRAARVNLEEGDAYYATFPWRAALIRRLGSGEVPLWDPSRFGGGPFAADIVQGVWYPPNWLYAVTGDFLWTYTVIALASLLGALLLAYWFLRLLRLHPLAACLGAVGFCCSAFLMKWSFEESVFGSAMWLPLALGGMELVHARGGARRRPGLGILVCTAGLALSLLAGHAQVAFYVWAATAVWGAVAVGARVREGARDRLAGMRATAGELAARAGLTALPLLLAAGLSAIQLLPTLELGTQTASQAYSASDVRGTSLTADTLLTMLVPDFWGNPVDRNYAPPRRAYPVYTELELYAGVVMLPLAAAGLFHRRRRLVGVFAGMVAVGFLAAFATPFYRLLLLLPGFNRFFFVTRFVLFVDAGLVWLAALGLDVLLTTGDRTPRRVLAATSVALGAFIVVAGLVVRTPVPVAYLAPRLARAVLLLLALAAVARLAHRRGSAAGAGVVALAVLDLWLFGFPLATWSRPEPIMAGSPQVQFLASLPGPRPRYAVAGAFGSFPLAPNAALVHGLYDIGGYDVDVPRSMAELLSVADRQALKYSNWLGPFEPQAFGSPIFDLVGISAVVGSGNGLSVAGAATDGGLRGSVTVLRRPGAFPPAFLAPCWVALPTRDVLPFLGAMTRADLRATVVLDAADARGAVLPQAPASGCSSPGDASVVLYEPESVVVRAMSPVGSLLVLSDTWYPGWNATIDGHPAPILKVDHALRAVTLPAGAHRVVFSYRPASFLHGQQLTALTLILLVAAGALAECSRRQSAGD